MIGVFDSELNDIRPSEHVFPDYDRATVYRFDSFQNILRDLEPRKTALLEEREKLLPCYIVADEPAIDHLALPQSLQGMNEREDSLIPSRQLQDHLSSALSELTWNLCLAAGRELIHFFISTTGAGAWA